MTVQSKFLTMLAEVPCAGLECRKKRHKILLQHSQGVTASLCRRRNGGCTGHSLPAQGFGGGARVSGWQVFLGASVVAVLGPVKCQIPWWCRAVTGCSDLYHLQRQHRSKQTHWDAAPLTWLGKKFSLSHSSMAGVSLPVPVQIGIVL